MGGLATSGISSLLRRMKPMPGSEAAGLPDDLLAQIAAATTTRGGGNYAPAEPLSRAMIQPPYADPSARMRPETIEPQDAPMRRMPQADIIGDTREAAFADPSMRRFAQRDLGVTDSESAQLNKRVRIPVDNGPRQVERGGVRGTLKSMGRGLLQGIALGGQAGGGGAIGGALAGLIHGGVSPQSVENVNYRMFQKPQYEHDAAIADKETGAQEDLARRIGQRTGIDPMTGNETADFKFKRMDDARADRALDLNDAYRRDQQANTQADRQNRNEDRDRTERERVASVAVQRAATMRRPVPPEAVKGTSLEGYGGMVPPNRVEDPMTSAQRAAQDLREREFKWKQEHGEDLTPGQRAAEDREERRTARRDAQDFDRKSREAEVALNAAQKAINKWKAAKAGNWSAEGQQSAAEDAAAAVEAAMTSHPEMLDGGTDGSNSYIKWRGGKKPTAPTSRVGARAQTMTSAEYESQKAKHGQAAVDKWLSDNKVTVQ